MAKCERCGASFDYDERQGVCPRCCYYNRPPGAARQDTEWMKYYNVEDNSYQLPKSEGVEDLFPEQKTRWHGKLHRDRQDGASGRQRRKTETFKANRRQSGRSHRVRGAWIGKVFGVIGIVCILLVAATAFLQIADEQGWRFSAGGEDTLPDRTVQVSSITPEEAAAGVLAGDVVYIVGEVRTLFQEGELSDLPPGEKCIGIWMEDSGASLEYTGYNWERPYVFDGTYYREMVDVDTLTDRYRFEGQALETASVYGAGYQDMSGYAIYFVNAEAQSVTLSLPCQVVDEDNTDVASCSEVMDVVLPLE